LALLFSEQGTKNISLNTTIIKTAKLNGLDPIEVLKTLLTKGLTPELSKQFGLSQARCLNSLSYQYQSREEYHHAIFSS